MFSALKANDAIHKDKDGYSNLSLSGSINHKFNQDNSIGLNFIKSSGNNKYDNRYDDLRIGKRILDDWNNDTCVGKYIKIIYLICLIK